MAVDIYDATLDDVDRLVMWDVRTADDPPPAMVEDWIVEGATILQGTIGDLIVDTPCSGEAFRARAKRIVALYAASMAEDAHYPERTMDREAGDHGSRLYNRWQLLSTALVTDVEKCRDGIVASGPTGGSAHSFPSPPMFSRDMGT